MNDHQFTMIKHAVRDRMTPEQRDRIAMAARETLEAKTNNPGEKQAKTIVNKTFWRDLKGLLSNN